MASIEQLKAQGTERRKQNSLTDGDYVLRDKKAERKEGVDKKNTRDITGEASQWAEAIEKVKAETRRAVEQEFLSSNFIADLTAKIKAELGPKTTRTTTGDK